MLRQDAATATLQGTALDEFPPLPAIDTGLGVFCDLSALCMAIDRVIDCAADDDSRPVLTGVLFEYAERKLTLATADGFRLAIDSVEADESAGPVKFLVPHETVRALRSAAGSTEGQCAIVVSGNGRQAKLVTDRFEIVTGLIEGNFPDYRKLIPQTHDVLLNFERERLAQAAKAVVPFAAGGSGIVRLVANDMTLEVSANEEGGDITRSLGLVSKVGRGRIACNIHFLVDVVGLKGMKSMDLAFTAEHAPMTFRSPDAPNWLEVLMPMSVQWDK